MLSRPGEAGAVWLRVSPSWEIVRVHTPSDSTIAGTIPDAWTKPSRVSSVMIVTASAGIAGPSGGAGDAVPTVGAGVEFVLGEELVETGVGVARAGLSSSD